MARAALLCCVLLVLASCAAGTEEIEQDHGVEKQLSLSFQVPRLVCTDNCTNVCNDVCYDSCTSEEVKSCKTEPVDVESCTDVPVNKTVRRCRKHCTKTDPPPPPPVSINFSLGKGRKLHFLGLADFFLNKAAKALGIQCSRKCRLVVVQTTQEQCQTTTKEEEVCSVELVPKCTKVCKQSCGPVCSKHCQLVKDEQKELRLSASMVKAHGP